MVNQQTNAGNNDEHHFAQLIRTNPSGTMKTAWISIQLRAGAEMFA